MCKEKIIVSKEQYNEVVNAKNYSEACKYVENNCISDAIKYGYGFYGIVDKIIENDKYIIVISIGSSCD